MQVRAAKQLPVPRLLWPIRGFHADGSSRMRYHIFISHNQKEASGEVGLLYHKLERLGIHCWCVPSAPQCV